MCSKNDVVQWKKIERFGLFLTLDIRILQFLTTFTKAYERPKKSVFIGLEVKNVTVKCAKQCD